MTPAASDGRMISSADGKGQLRNLQATDLKNSRSHLGSDLTPMLAVKQSWKLDFPEDTRVDDVQMATIAVPSFESSFTIFEGEHEVA